jgi:hypothetical protein
MEASKHYKIEESDGLRWVVVRSRGLQVGSIRQEGESWQYVSSGYGAHGDVRGTANTENDAVGHLLSIYAEFCYREYEAARKGLEEIWPDGATRRKLRLRSKEWSWTRHQ